MTKVLLSGCNGRMGRAISEMCKKIENTVITAGVDLFTERHFDYPVYDSFSATTEDCDVVIDFSNPKTLPSLLEYCTSSKKPLVLCTTGLSDEDQHLTEPFHRAAYANIRYPCP